MNTFVIIFIIVIIILIFLPGNTNNPKGDKNHVIQDGVKWVHIDDVKITNPLARKVFDWYKDAILNKNIIVKDEKFDQIRQEFGEIIKINESLPDNDEQTFIDALSSEFLIGSLDCKPDWLIMKPKEECLFLSQLSALDTVKSIYKNISYVGMRDTKNGMRIGCGSLYTNNVEGLTRFDAGDIVVTNQRIIFKGEKKSKTINISNIISIDNFEDNGVIMTMSNSENPIVIRFLADKCFHYNEKEGMRFFYNDLNGFYRAMTIALSLR